jgi:hypothetical protein
MVALVLLMPSLAMPAKTKAVIQPASVQHTIGGSSETTGARGFALPPSPPGIEGAPAPDASGPGAPTLDMRGLPNLSVEERELPLRKH